MFGKSLAAVVLVGMLLGLAPPSEASGGVSDAFFRIDPPHAQDHVLVKLAPEAGPQFHLAPEGQRVLGRWHTQPVPPGQSPVEFVEFLETRPGVEDAELDYEFGIGPEPVMEALSVVEGSEVNDPLASYQWHLPAVQATEAWSSATGEGVIVAVVDSGVSLEGEDLDCHSFVAPYNAITETTGTGAASDDNGHGTHVAGTVAQCTNNGVGVAGVAFDVSLMPVKVLDGNGNGQSSWIARGIDWSRSHGADVVNLSLGCEGCTSALIDDAIEAAAADGVVILAASGNEGAASVFYPANHPDVIAVGATDFDQQRAWYSNGGTALDVVAPGGDLSQDANGDGQPDGVLQETFGPGDVWGYYWLNGTSMATPHVSGAAALLISLHPGLPPETVRQALENTARDLGPSGFDTSYGHGLIQIRDLLDADVDPPVWPAGALLVVSRYGETSLTFSWSKASDNEAVTGYQLGASGTKGLPSTARQLMITGLASGSQYLFEVLARDGAGNWSEPLTATVRTARHFEDTAGHIFYDDILWMSGTDVTRGCNPPDNDLFCPDDPVTRGQMAAFLVRALDLSSNTHPGFGDVPSTSTFALDIGRLATSGITKGCNPPDNDLFCPDDPVTRGELAAFLHRALG